MKADMGFFTHIFFALDEIPLHLFDKTATPRDQILCRDVHGDEKKPSL